MKPTVWMCAGMLLASLLQGSALAADKTPDAAKADRIEALRRLDSTDVKTRRRAVEQLATAGQMADVPDLLASLDDDDSAVRAGAERAVWAIWSRSGDPEVDRLFAEGADHLAHRRLVESVQVFSHVIELKPDFAEGWNKRATALFLAGDLDASAADCDEVLKRNPAHFGALSGYGLISIQQGRLERALDYFERALAINPNMVGVQSNIDAIRQILAKRGRRET